MFLQQSLYTVKGVTKVFIQEESLHTKTAFKKGTSHQQLSNRVIISWRKVIVFAYVAGYLLFTHPVVNLLSISVEELQVHALFILLPTNLPQLQQGLLLLCKNSQLHTNSNLNIMHGSVTPKKGTTASHMRKRTVGSRTFSFTSSEA